MAFITIVGSMNLDINVRVPRFATAGETLTGSDLEETPGGKSSNQAAAAARLGAAVRLVGAVGDDPAGRYLVDEAEALGIDTSHIARLADVPTGRAIIQVDARGENTITVIPGANERVTGDLLDDAALDNSSIVSLALEIPVDAVLQAARMSRRQGSRTILNLSPFQELPAELLGLVDVLLVNEHEAAQFVGEAEFSVEAGVALLAERLTSAGIGAAVVTLGAAGSLVVHREGGADAPFVSFRVPAYPVKAVDTTGCGDAFTGALAARLAAGASLADAVQTANATGGFAATRRGAQSSYPSADELAAWVAARE